MAVALPPSTRDFEIHRLACVEFVSTRKIARKFGISQTRVRQIIEAVGRWLAETLPMRTEVEVEQDKRLALHLGAAQLQHQLEQLAELWAKTSDPKFLRQQTRCILAMARLGVVAGAIDGLAAEAEEAEEGSGFGVQGSGEGSGVRSQGTGRSRQAAAAGQYEIQKLKSEIASAPPVGDCSTDSAEAPGATGRNEPEVAVNPNAAAELGGGMIPEDADLEDLEVIELHLLSLLRETNSSDVRQRDALERALAECRQRRDAYESKVFPAPLGAAGDAVESTRTESIHAA